MRRRYRRRVPHPEVRVLFLSEPTRPGRRRSRRRFRANGVYRQFLYSVISAYGEGLQQLHAGKAHPEFHGHRHEVARCAGQRGASAVYFHAPLFRKWNAARRGSDRRRGQGHAPGENAGSGELRGAQA